MLQRLEGLEGLFLRPRGLEGLFLRPRGLDQSIVKDRQVINARFMTRGSRYLEAINPSFMTARSSMPNSPELTTCR